MTEVLVRVIDAYVYYYESNKLSFLLLKRSRTKIYEYLWQGVAGKIEKNELAWQAALRELKEETGINEVEIDSGWSHRTEYTFQKKGKPVEKQVFWYIASTNQLEVKLSHEHTNYLWLSFDDAEDQLTFEQEKSLLREARAYLNPAN